MDSASPIKKRTTISRWGPALTAEEKAANVEAQKALPNGTGSDSKEKDDKPACRIIKIHKISKNKEKAHPEPVNIKNKSSASEDNSEKSDESTSSNDSDFLGFEECDTEKKTAFLKILSNYRKSIEEEEDREKNDKKPVHESEESDIEEEEEKEKESFEKENSEKESFEKEENLESSPKEESQPQEMTVDTRPEEEDDTDNSVDKSNSEEMEIDEHVDTEPVTKDNDDNTVEKTSDTMEQEPESDKDVDYVESMSIKEEVLSITDDGKDMDDKPLDSESSLMDTQPDSEQSPNSISTTDTSVLNETPNVSTGKKRSRRESQKIKKPVIDVSNPVYLKPFDFGWKRELVFRSTNDSSTSIRRQADVYYYTPKGKKVRSFREVSEHLIGQELTIDNFTFFKEAIGLDDPEKEIIRDAKFKLIKDGSSATPSPILKKTLTPKISKAPKTPKTTPVSTQELIADTPTTTSASPSPSTPKSVTPRVVFRGKPKLNSGTKFTATQSKTSVPGQAQKIIISKVSKKGKNKSDDDEMTLGMLPPLWQPNEKVSKKEPSHTKKPPSSAAGKPMEVCSIRCPLAMGLIPTLQCHMCLCLYHPVCVGLEEAMNRTIHSYKCKNCQLTPAKCTPTTKTCLNTILPPPPLTPISSLTSTSSSPGQFSPNNPPPKLTRLTDGKLVSVARTQSKPQVPKTQSIVGGVTTWLPPSSSIQLSPSAPKLSPSFKNSSTASTTTVDTSSSLPLQTLISMNGKRYVVVPKHNVLSVSPTVTAPSISIDPSCQQITTQSEISPLTGQAYGPGGPILPKPTSTSGPTFLVSSPATPTTTFQNPPGVLLVPYLAPPSSPQQPKDGVQPAAQPQYVIVNGPSGLQAGNFIFGNLPQQQLQLPAVPTSQAAEPPSESAGTKRSAETPEKVLPTKKLKFDESNSMPNFVQNISIGYKALLQSFQYLKVQELLRAARVCQMWRDIAMHKSLWETVKMKNSRVRDWEGVSQTLRRVGTCHLDLRKMIVPDKSDSLRNMWSDFIKCISKVNTLVKLDLCRCSSQVIEQVANACPQLEYLNALSIRSNEINLAALGGCKNLIDLRLKGVTGMEVSNVSALKTLNKLKHLSLTSVKNMSPDFAEVLSKMVLLETLELGECTDLPEKFVTECLPVMTRLRRLRLEKGQGSECPTILLLETISRCPSITQLELINFDVKTGFDTALGLCSNIKSFLIIPTYVTQSATTNHVIIEGVSKLSKTLTYFVWGLTLELLRVTDLFIDQWEGQKNNIKTSTTPHKKGSNDCIPILKPDKDSEKNKDGSAPPLQVDVLQLSKLHKVLMTLLPTTQIKILKVPFSATWRQTIPGTSQ